MKACVFDGHTVRVDLAYPDPAAAQGEVHVQVRLAGVCQTDLEIVKGYMGFTGVLGHEFVGIVERTNDPKLLGRRVVGEINVSCGRCSM